METPDDDARIAAITAQGRATRRPVSRATWIVAALIGVACAVGFVVMMLVDSPPADSGASPPREGSGTGFTAGLAVGIGIGIALGFVLARRPRAQVSAHSSRSRP